MIFERINKLKIRNKNKTDLKTRQFVNSDKENSIAMHTQNVSFSITLSQ